MVDNLISDSSNLLCNLFFAEAGGGADRRGRPDPILSYLLPIAYLTHYLPTYLPRRIPIV
jgi:hypothetical protein